MDNPIVTNIQRFSLYDGPGIRTTVFLKGCLATCPWCANPENKGSIIADNTLSLKAYPISCDELYIQLIKDREFYGEKGGVTFSGGEPLLQIDRIVPLLKKLTGANINVCFETSLFASPSQVALSMQYADCYYIDVKILDKVLAQEILHIDLDQYYDNVNLLFRNKKKIRFRIPFISGYNSDEKNVQRIVEFLTNYSPTQVEILIGHNLAKKKYMALGLNYNSIPMVNETVVEEFEKKLIRNGILAKILNL